MNPSLGLSGEPGQSQIARVGHVGEVELAAEVGVAGDVVSLAIGGEMNASATDGFIS